MHFTTSACNVEKMSVGRKVVQIARRKGLSPSALARALGVKPQTVQQWGSGETNPRGVRLQEIAKVLGVHPFVLVDESVDIDSLDTGEVTEQRAEYTVLAPDEKAILEKYRLLTGKEKTSLQTITDALASKTDRLGKEA